MAENEVNDNLEDLEVAIPCVLDEAPSKGKPPKQKSTPSKKAYGTRSKG
ncbi:hypothetical protein A2U01_0114591, partial [Trifolium medium]|nr:hypothetical protein [Trifolium medium]